MSGNFVQRGMPAVFDKAIRAEAALRCGADLVLELPVTYSLSSAEGFASGGVRILSGFCHNLCFGTESANPASLEAAAHALLSPEFTQALRTQLEQGISFPAARQQALETMGQDSTALCQPNDILAVEYCKAILSQKSTMIPMPIHREGSYHDTTANRDNPSATAVRALIHTSGDWQGFIPKEARVCFENAPIHDLSYGERGILARLRCMDEADFEALPYGSEGLWRKFMHAVHSHTTVEEILEATKSKRYTRTRLNRMLMCAFLGITQAVLETPAPYVRALGFTSRGREILKAARQTGEFPNIGEHIPCSYQDLENRCSDLYGLFTQTGPEVPNIESKRRVICL